MTQLGIATDLQALLSLIDPKGLTLLEAGCGDGSLARQLVGQGATVMGLEPDPVQATKNAQAEPMVGLSFHESPADQMPLEDASVHGVIFSLSLHHIPKPLMGPSLREAHRVLKPGGFLAVVEPIADGSNNHVMELFHDEREVRDVAIEALERDAAPLFEQRQQYFYTTERRFGRFED
ncbi:MAG: class I SAM-dependent methyltransferase, partial [Gammaproteobacteria bacterium]